MNIILYIFFLILTFLFLERKNESYPTKDKEKCRNCGKKMDSTFLYCPYCQEEIKKNCDSCGRLIYADWRYCPFCDEEDHKNKGHTIDVYKNIGGKRMKKSIVLVMVALTLVFSGIWVGFSKKQPLKDNPIKIDKEDIYYEENKDTTSNEPDVDEENNDIASNEPAIDEESVIRYDSDNGIDMAVIFNNVLEQDDKNIVFKVMVNNHKIDLENIKYAELVKLKLSDGSIVDQGFEWETVGGGHHIYGYLKLPKIYNGENIISQDIDNIQLEFEGVGNAEKLSFQWEKEILDIYISGGEEHEN